MRSDPRTDDLKKLRVRLVDVLSTLAAIYPPPPGRRHGSVEAILLTHGRWFRPGDLPLGRPRGPEQRCFANAWRHSEIYDLPYVEGYATADSAAPFAHAWCARPDGTVEDPTWDCDGRAYFGIPFAAEFVRRRPLKPLLFDQHLSDWQFLQEGTPDDAIAGIGQLSWAT